jgi:hypothetical protein
MYSEKTNKRNINSDLSIPIPQLLQYAFGWFNPEPYYAFPFDNKSTNRQRKVKQTNTMYDMSQSIWVESNLFMRESFIDSNNFNIPLVDSFTNAMVHLVFYPVTSVSFTNKFKFSKLNDNETYIKYIPLSKILEIDMTSLSTKNNFLIMSNNDMSDGSFMFNSTDKLYHNYKNDMLYFDNQNMGLASKFFKKDADRNKRIKIQMLQENIINRKDLDFRKRMEQFLFNHAPFNEKMTQPHGFSPNTGEWLGASINDKFNSVPTDKIVFVEDDAGISKTNIKNTQLSRIDPDRFDFFNWSDIEYDDDDFHTLDFGKLLFSTTTPKSNKPAVEIVISSSNEDYEDIILDSVFGGIPTSISTTDLVKYVDSKFANIPNEIFDNIRSLSNFNLIYNLLSFADPKVDRGQSFDLGTVRKYILKILKTTQDTNPILPYDVILTPNKLPDEFWDRFNGSDVTTMKSEAIYPILKKLVRGILLKGNELTEKLYNQEPIYEYHHEATGETYTIKLRIIKSFMVSNDLAWLASLSTTATKSFNYLDHVNRVNNIMQILSMIDVFMKVILSRSTIGGKLYLPNFGKDKIRVGQELHLVDDRQRVPLYSYPNDRIIGKLDTTKALKNILFRTIKETRGSVRGLKFMQDAIRESHDLQEFFKINGGSNIVSEDKFVEDDTDTIFSLAFKNNGFRSNPFFVWKVVTYIGQSSSGESSTSGYTQKVYLSDMSVFWNNKFEEDDYVSRMAEELIGKGFPLIDPTVFEDD